MTQLNESERLTAWQNEREQLAAEARQKRLDDKHRERELNNLSIDLAAEDLLRDFNTRDAFGADIRNSERLRRGAQRRRFFLSMIIPIAAAIVWSLWIAQPLFQTTSSFVVLSPQNDTAQSPNNLFVAQDLTDRNHGAFLAVNLVQAKARQDGLSQTKFQASTIELIERVTQTPRASGIIEAHLNIQSGVVSLSGFAPDAKMSNDIVHRYLAYIANEIDLIYGARNRSRVEDAERRLRKARSELEDAVLAVHKLRQTHGDIDPSTRLNELNAQISELESARLSAQTELRSLEIANGGHTLQADRLRALLGDFEDRISTLRNPTSDVGLDALSSASLAYKRAIFNLNYAQDSVAIAQSRFEEALKAATLSKDLMQVVVKPIQQNQSAYPRIWVLLALAAGAGICIFTLIELWQTGRRKT
ncbi:MAG: hypothetical protein AAFR98_03895 [Pseudomonadota bacterium]